MTGTLRPVAPIKAPDVTPSALGEPPALVWIALEELVINDAYQRHISEKSVTLIRRMVARFDWGRVKALSVVAIGGGKYEVIDGQHTAIAAATHGGIETLPCLLTRDRDAAMRAADFVSLNRDRLAMTPMQVFFAELAAGEELAGDVDRGVRAAGGRVLKYPPPHAKFDVGDAVCVAQLRALARAGGVAYVKRAVRICVEGRCAPVKAVTLKALQKLIWGGKGLSAGVTDIGLAAALARHGQEGLISLAQRRREQQGGSLADALADILRMNGSELS